MILNENNPGKGSNLEVSSAGASGVAAPALFQARDVLSCLHENYYTHDPSYVICVVIFAARFSKEK